MSRSIKLNKASDMFVSQPNPYMFGNPQNDESKCWSNKNWLKSRFHFSFAEYSDYNRQNFGVLRVMNDDLVQPNRGFGEHPHRNMEICTYVVKGALTHKDSMGTQETLKRGGIQYMSAGSGVRHSEFNKSRTEPLRFIQMWINSRETNTRPNYGQYDGNVKRRHNQWEHLVSDQQATSKSSKTHTPVTVNQDVNMYCTELDAEKSLSFQLATGRQAYMLCIEGTVTVKHNGDGGAVMMVGGDSMEVRGEHGLTVHAGEKGAHCLIVEMKKV